MLQLPPSIAAFWSASLRFLCEANAWPARSSSLQLPPSIAAFWSASLRFLCEANAWPARSSSLQLALAMAAARYERCLPVVCKEGVRTVSDRAAALAAYHQVCLVLRRAKRVHYVSVGAAGGVRRRQRWRLPLRPHTCMPCYREGPALPRPPAQQVCSHGGVELHGRAWAYGTRSAYAEGLLCDIESVARSPSCSVVPLMLLMRCFGLRPP